MRPRGSPRGIRLNRRPRTSFGNCFNEAAGKSPRNPDTAPGAPLLKGHASMRPRGSPRGIGRIRHVVEELIRASMRPRGSPRGIHRDASARIGGTSCFNEAAGKSPRNLSRRITFFVYTDAASMRPRGSPRGIGPLVTDCGPRCWLPECERSRGCCERAGTVASFSRDHSLQLSSCQRVAGARALPGGATALERSRHGGGRSHTMTGSRRTA